MYYAHSGYPGGLKKQLDKLQAENEMIIEKAVKGMLPKGPWSCNVP